MVLASRVLSALILGSAAAQQPEPLVIDAGPLRCEVHLSRTAHLFHVVDQISAWDQYDTVFKVETTGRVGIYPPSTYTMSASASASGHAAAAAADGSYLT